MEWRSPVTNALFLGGLGLLSYFLATRMFFRRRTDAKFDAMSLLPERSADSALADAPVEILRWQVAMHETARDLKAEIDTKMVALQILIRDAEKAIERLEKLKGPPESGST